MTLSKNIVLVASALPILGLCGWALYYIFTKSDETEEEKTQNSGSIVIEVKVPIGSVGSVIGRGGSNIKEVQEKTNTRIAFMDAAPDADYRICRVRGLPENAQLAEALILAAVHNQPFIESYEMYVPQKACGRIIGKNGETIRSIYKQSNAAVNVSRDESDGEFRRVTIKGTAEQIEMAKLLIEEKITEDSNARQKMQQALSNRAPRNVKRPTTKPVNNLKRSLTVSTQTQDKLPSRPLGSVNVVPHENSPIRHIELHSIDVTEDSDVSESDSFDLSPMDIEAQPECSSELEVQSKLELKTDLQNNVPESEVKTDEPKMANDEVETFPKLDLERDLYELEDDVEIEAVLDLEPEESEVVNDEVDTTPESDQNSDESDSVKDGETVPEVKTEDDDGSSTTYYSPYSTSGSVNLNRISPVTLLSDSTVESDLSETDSSDLSPTEIKTQAPETKDLLSPTKGCIPQLLNPDSDYDLDNSSDSSFSDEDLEAHGKTIVASTPVGKSQSKEEVSVLVEKSNESLDPTFVTGCESRTSLNNNWVTVTEEENGSCTLLSDQESNETLLNS